MVQAKWRNNGPAEASRPGSDTTRTCRKTAMDRLYTNHEEYMEYEGQTAGLAANCPDPALKPAGYYFVTCSPSSW